MTGPRSQSRQESDHGFPDQVIQFHNLCHAHCTTNRNVLSKERVQLRIVTSGRNKAVFFTIVLWPFMKYLRIFHLICLELGFLFSWNNSYHKSDSILLWVICCSLPLA